MAADKVFGSDIIRTHNLLKNNLYEILKVDPVTPLPVNNTNDGSCDFTPKTDKYFVPKKKLRLKVKTVRDIRNLFEKDIYATLECDLEKQQNLLFRKIRGGSSKDEKTKLLATNILKSEKPISRVAWQMIINVNPNEHPQPCQYVLWNGKCIQVNGSRGGKYKFICKYDISAQRMSFSQNSIFNKSNIKKMKSLLRNSLNVKFKPGPLSRKKELDVSYQKYNVGSVESVKLPNPGLVIIPEYGKPLELSISNYLHNLRNENGIISEKWAEFAVSTLGREENGSAVHLSKDSSITFDLKYKYEQRQLLMRNGDEKFSHGDLKTSPKSITETENTMQEVQTMLDEMLVSIEISLQQENMFTGEDPPREIDVHDITTSSSIHSRDKLKRNGELNRLDVTVIRLFNEDHKSSTKNCNKSFCSLGCICDSIHSSFHLKNHCGRVECMFECKCDFSKYSLHEVFEDDIIPGILNIDKENNLKLSKEEQKFHQTVVLSGEKSVLLRTQKRNWKAPKRYADFYSSMCLKTKKEIEKNLSVDLIKLNCTNVVSWCMVHNLYKCFCKGKFTEKLSESVSGDLVKTSDDGVDTTKLPEPDNLKDIGISNTEVSIVKNNLRPRRNQDTDNVSKKKISTDAVNSWTACDTYGNCARTKAYKGRKYSNIYYFNANKKILEMEQNDTSLRKRMIKVLNSYEISDTTKMTEDCNSQSDNIPTIDLSATVDTTDRLSISVEENESSIEGNDKIQSKLPNNPELNDGFETDTCNNSRTISDESAAGTNNSRNKKLKSWLEPILKIYRKRFSNGFFKKSLDPPKFGKVALYPWDFIIERYKEKKNFFLITRKKPYRIFMAINNRNALFDNCININEITNVEQYPMSVRNLINNEIDGLKDHLCILRGLDFCWELVGSVKKVCEMNKDAQNNSNQTSDTDESPSQSLFDRGMPATSDGDNMPLTFSVETNKDQSKWFVMTLENDFSEIQFYNRGFFVKYDSIIKAINVARVSEKTVRLSSQKCSDGNSDPQFGIYAIPNANKYCVFIGPYEKNEPLGIETVKTTSCKKNRTRGVWITTNKIDNIRVIDNPLSFMSQINLEDEQVMVDTLPENNVDSLSGNGNSKIATPSPPKLCKIAPKPIKITKTNSFYHLTSSGLLKQVSVSPEKPSLVIKSPILINKRLSSDVDSNVTKWPLLCNGSSLTVQPKKRLALNEKIAMLSSNKPVAEIAPQVKVTEDVMSSKVQGNILSRKRPMGMSILKPEEINERSLVNRIVCTPTSTLNIKTMDSVETMEMHMDIENFLANSTECSAPSSDIYVISDDEDYCSTENTLTDVGIVCSNIENIGWIPGRLNANKLLSFQFPGFRYTDFYPEEEALDKVNQVLSRKIYVPKSLHLTWSVVESKDLEGKPQLKQEHLGQDNILTKRGLLHKSELAGRLKSKKKIKDLSSTSSKSPSKIKEDFVLNKANMDKLEAESNLLDEETKILFGQLTETNSHILTMSNDARQEISDRLRSIISNSES